MLMLIQGYLNLKSIIKFLSQSLTAKKEVIISSTGVIGEQLPLKKMTTWINY